MKEYINGMHNYMTKQECCQLCIETHPNSYGVTCFDKNCECHTKTSATYTTEDALAYQDGFNAGVEAVIEEVSKKHGGVANYLREVFKKELTK